MHTLFPPGLIGPGRESVCYVPPLPTLRGLFYLLVEAWIFGPRGMKRKGTVSTQRDALERFLGADKEGEETMFLFAMQSGKFE
jgi:hypothetical protein